MIQCRSAAPPLSSRRSALQLLAQQQARPRAEKEGKGREGAALGAALGAAGSSLLVVLLLLSVVVVGWVDGGVRDRRGGRAAGGCCRRRDIPGRQGEGVLDHLLLTAQSCFHPPTPTRTQLLAWGAWRWWARDMSREGCGNRHA